jgi:hypothetical protein
VLTSGEKLKSGKVVPRCPFLLMVEEMGLEIWPVGLRYVDLHFALATR